MILLLTLALQAAPPPGPVPQAGSPRPGQPPATILVEPAAMFLAACDADADARVTAAERTACLQRSFAAAEGAARGSIGFIAYADWAQRWLGDRNALPGPYELDRDGDTRVSLPELQSRFAALAARYDLDRDGVLTRAELVTIRSAPPGQGPGERRPDGERGRRGDRQR